MKPRRSDSDSGRCRREPAREGNLYHVLVQPHVAVAVIGSNVDQGIVHPEVIAGHVDVIRNLIDAEVKIPGGAILAEFALRNAALRRYRLTAFT